MRKLLGPVIALICLFCGCAAARGDTPSGGFSVSPAPQASGAPAGAVSSAPAVSGGAPATFRLTVPEGYTLARIGMTLEDEGFCTADEFIRASQEADYSGFSLIGALAPSERRCFTLEGYLFPDTYEFYSVSTPEDIIREMLDNAERRIDGELREAAAASGRSVDEIMIMASIIEKESLGGDVMPIVSSVIHNRLSAGMKLQMDVTIVYVEGAIKPFIGGDVNRYNEAYNTYKCAGLPAGAICNPGLAAVRAALAPADTDYLYFVTDSDGEFYFAQTFEEHEANCREAGIS